MRTCTITIALALMAGLSGTSSLAQTTAEARASVSKRFPPGSIRSVSEADIALADASAERAGIEARYLADEQGCHPKFFATSCIEQAKERRRAALAAVRPVEIEANAFKRQARVAERDKALAERMEKDEKERQERQERQERDGRMPGADPGSKADAPANPPGKVQTTIFDDRVEKHEAKMKQRQAEEAADAAKRAENIAAYERKQQEALERQRKVAERKAEKERKRNGKAE
ncbi:hypothetical protein [Noviherbaspirillum sp.]|uniref:hypothetical protein n=1 Tax=Noviherbaspirillum sp. TaxID=1926288 RepID=UPI002D3FE56F|nr:hypothetical protein [Noviherbaspirillum sp.]HZW20443.1 hypothetical protein [Noviherbaspirillum sp.]